MPNIIVYTNILLVRICCVDPCLLSISLLLFVGQYLFFVRVVLLTTRTIAINTSKF